MGILARGILTLGLLTAELWLDGRGAGVHRLDRHRLRRLDRRRLHGRGADVRMDVRLDGSGLDGRMLGERGLSERLPRRSCRRLGERLRLRRGWHLIR